MQERHDKLFDIQFFADDGDESDDGKNKGGGSGGDPVILAEELTAGEFETLDKTFRRAYVEFALMPFLLLAVYRFGVVYLVVVFTHFIAYRSYAGEQSDFKWIKWAQKTS